MWKLRQHLLTHKIAAASNRSSDRRDHQVQIATFELSIQQYKPSSLTDTNNFTRIKLSSFLHNIKKLEICTEDIIFFQCLGCLTLNVCNCNLLIILLNYHLVRRIVCLTTLHWTSYLRCNVLILRKHRLVRRIVCLTTLHWMSVTVTNSSFYPIII